MKRLIGTSFDSPSLGAMSKPTKYKDARFLFRVLVGLLLLAAGALLWLIHAEQVKGRQKALAEVVQTLVQNHRFVLQGNQDYFALLAEDCAKDTLSAEEFQSRVSRYVGAHPELINVTWVDAALVIRDVAPAAPNQQIVGLRLTLPEPKRAANLARERRAPVYTRPFEAIQGIASFEVWVPVFRGDEFLGLFAGVYSCPQLLQRIMTPQMAQWHHLELRDEAGSLLGESPLKGSPDASLRQEAELSPPGQGMRVRLQTYGSGEGRTGQILLAVFCGALATWLIFSVRARGQAEESLRETEAQNRALISAIPDLVFTNRRDGEFLAVHASKAEQLLMPPEAFLHKRIPEILPSPLADRLLRAFEDALDSGEVQELNYTLFMGGQERYFEARVVPRTGDTLITIVRDVTDRQLAEEAQRRLAAQLQQAQKMESLGSLAGGVAHDMNNVLGAILGLASAHLETQPPGSPAYRAFDTISQAAERGGKMVKSLLSFARQSPVETLELDLNAVLREEVRMLERTTLSRIRLEMDLAPDLRPIRGDANALTHAFMNLCVNAVDAMPEGGTLTLRTRNVDDDGVEVLVEDTGAGMSPEVLERALDPFFTTKASGKGTGLGLSMVYSTLKAHQGRMDLQSEAGRGTRVRMRFPACEAPTQATETAGEAPPAPSRRERTVLVVDDDELVRSSMEALLEALGHRAITTSSGEEALEKLKAGLDPEVVILDMNMPGLGGAETLPRLRALRPAVPIFLATGRADQSALDLIEAHPGVTLLSKPFSMKDLQFHLEALERG